MKTLLTLLLFSSLLIAQNIIDITVRGISDQQNDGAQQDRLEAIMDAKRQACEKAGLIIESRTTVENFQVVYDLVETQAATVLLPGFQLVEIGYVQDGTYQVVLSGKIKILDEEKNISTKEMRYAKSLRDRGKHTECEAILKKYIDLDDPQVSDELKEEAFYYYLKWGYAWNLQESVQKFAAFYPESKYLPGLESFADFAVKPCYTHNLKYQANADDWKPTNLLQDEITFSKYLHVTTDTIIFKNFKGQDQTILLDVNLFSDAEKKATTAYSLKISYYDGNLIQQPTADALKVIEDRFRIFQPGGSTTFQHSSSGVQFNDYKLSHFQFDGDVPVGKGPFFQQLKFDIYQISY